MPSSGRPSGRMRVQRRGSKVKRGGAKYSTAASVGTRRVYGEGANITLQYLSALLRNCVQQFLCVLPAEARVSDRFSVYMAGSDLLASLYKVAFNHDALDKFPDIFIDPAAVQDLFNNADLLLIFLAGVGMVGVDEDGRVLQISFFIFFQKKLDVFIVIVGDRVPVFVYGPSEDRVGKRIAFRTYFPASGDEIMSALCRDNGVEHNGKVSAGGVLHTHRDIQTADHQTVLLIFHGAGADGYIGEDVGEIMPVVRVEHLIRSSKSGL